jgi:hypothetical protein
MYRKMRDHGVAPMMTESTFFKQAQSPRGMI